MRASDPVLLLIDFQNGFQDSAFFGPRNNPLAEEHAALLLDAWRRRGLSVIHTRHAPPLKHSPLRATAPGHEFIAALAPRAGEAVLTKTGNSAFVATDLEDRLIAIGHPPLVIAGVPTDHCVSATVRTAADLGFGIVVAGDACFTFDRDDPSAGTILAEDVHRANLASLHGEVADVRSTPEIIAGLETQVQPRPR